MARAAAALAVALLAIVAAALAEDAEPAAPQHFVGYERLRRTVDLQQTARLYAAGPEIEQDERAAKGSAGKAVFHTKSPLLRRRVRPKHLPPPQTEYPMRVGQLIDSWSMEVLDGDGTRTYRYDGTGGMRDRSVLLLALHPQSHEQKQLWFSASEYAPALEALPPDVDVIFYGVGEDAGAYAAFMRERRAPPRPSPGAPGATRSAGCGGVRGGAGEARAAALFEGPAPQLLFGAADPLEAARRRGRRAGPPLPPPPLLPRHPRAPPRVRGIGAPAAGSRPGPSPTPPGSPSECSGWAATGTAARRRRRHPREPGAGRGPAPPHPAAGLEAAGPRRGRRALAGAGAGPAAASPNGTAPREEHADLRGAVALVRRGRCSFYEKVMEAQRRNASGVLIYTGAEEPKGAMGCGSGECAGAAIPALMIDFAEGARLHKLLAAGAHVYVGALDPQAIPPHAVAIDREHRVRRLGLLRRPVVANGTFQGTIRPSLAAAVLETRTYGYFARVERRKAALASTPGTCGFGELAVELRVQCHRRDDASCGEWDKVLSLSVCQGRPGDPGATCQEALRWITSYGREARWLSEARGVLPLLYPSPAPAPPHRALRGRRQRRRGGGSGVGAAAGGGRLGRLAGHPRPPPRPAPAGGPVPAAAAALWCCGGGFGPGYNAAFGEKSVAVPAWAARTELWVLLTGHGWGSDEENCAEFCPTEHAFSVQGPGARPATHRYALDAAGTADGCGDAAAVDRGVVPNQYGTWYFGRAGWCPGAAVPHYAEDVTADVKAGAGARLTYRGTFNGTDYVPVPAKHPGEGGFPANFNWLAWLVFYR
eukprot:tig00001258_g7831.t1